MTKTNPFISSTVPLMISLAGGALLGGAMFLLGKFVSILFLGPLAAGAAVGFAVSGTFKRNYSTLFTTVVVVLMSCMAYQTKHFAEYHDFRQNISEHLLPESTPGFLSNIVETIATPFVDDFFELKTGHSGFRGYMIYSAEQPIPVGFGKVLELGKSGTWTLRIFELLIIIGIGMYIIQMRNRPVAK